MISVKKERLSDYKNRKSRRRIWQEDEVHKLIFVWRMRLEDLRQSKKNRHIYEEISDELNRMGLDTIREEVHIKIQNLSQLYRNEKRRIEATGEAPSWSYYHEVDELLGSNQDNTMDSTTVDESIDIDIDSSAFQFSKNEVVSIGDSGSDNEIDDSQLSYIEHRYKNGFESKLPIVSLEHVNTFPSPSPSTSLASSARSITNKPQITSTNSTQQIVNKSRDSIETNGTTTSIQIEILNEIKKANALSEREHHESKMLHQEMKELEMQRFNLTQMFIERSLALQKQMLDSLRMNRSNGGTAALTTARNTSIGGSMNAVSSAINTSLKILPRTQSARPQFVLTKKKK